MPLHPSGARMEATKSGGADHVRAVLRQGMNDLEARNKAQLTAFIWACNSGSALGGVHRIACGGGVQQGRRVRCRRHGADARGLLMPAGAGSLVGGHGRRQRCGRCWI